MATRPNILFILADDLGWADLSVYGQTSYNTPHLDQLASQGVRFTQAYANSAVCSATRFALITGRYQYHFPGGLEEPLISADNNLGLDPQHPTLPSLLKQAGYATALIGKWHLGKPPAFHPLHSGYDYFFGNLGGAIDYFTHKNGVQADLRPDLWENTQAIEREGYYTYLLADQTKQYMTEHVQAQHSAQSNQPFFISLHFTAPHWPWEGPQDQEVSQQLKDLFHYDGGSVQKYGEIVQALDQAIGEVLEQLEQVGLADNTIVVFSSDNGGERFSKTWPLTGQKTELLEGGIRVPTLLRWPAQIQPQVQEQVAISMDWLPTLLDAAGVSLDPSYPIDGVSLLPVLQQRIPSFERQLYWRYKANGQRALRQGDYKYLKINDHEFLFNVVEDPRERANLKHRHADLFSELKEKWERIDQRFLPLHEHIFSHGLSPDIQADRYAPQQTIRHGKLDKA